jgi:hypothetical protein
VDGAVTLDAAHLVMICLATRLQRLHMHASKVHRSAAAGAQQLIRP